MSLVNDDLDDCIKKFRNILYEQDAHKITETDLWSLIENLINELELSKENESCLRKNLEKCLDSEHGEVAIKYIHLREKCKQFEEETLSLRGRMEDLQMQMITDVEILKDDFFQKFSELEKTYKCEISMLKEKIESEKKYHEAKEKKLYDELQLAQATTDLRCDDIESNLKSQLVDANNKLRQSHNVIRGLQIDINRLKNQSSLINQQVFHTPHSKPSKPEIRFQPLPITSRKSIVDYDFESDDLEFEAPPPETTMLSLPRPKTFSTLNSSSNNSFGNNTPARTGFTRESTTPIVFRGHVRNLTKTNIPATNKIRRKRKLYDPDSFEESNIPQFSQE